MAVAAVLVAGAAVAASQLGFLRADDARLASLPWARRTILGAYAAPVSGDAA